MSEVVVFVGPTLSARDVLAVLPAAEVAPPAAQGDVLELALRGTPRVIAIVDGYYESVPAVWHKEILWAMSEGIHVFGAASMGALRAAELAAFGMEGVGAIFEAYRDGDLVRDDEVAVLHGPPEDGYRQASTALVNIRATVGAALLAGVVDESLRDAVVHVAEDLFYPDRSYPALVLGLRRRGLGDAEIDAFAEFARRSPVDQKRTDALEMLELIRDRLSAGLPRKTVSFTLQRSSYLELLREEVLARPGRSRRHDERADLSGSRSHDGWLDEVRIDPLLQRQVHALAAGLVAADAEAAERRLQFGDERALLAAADAFRRETALTDSEEFSAFLAREEIEDADLPRLFASYAALRWHRETSRERVLARYRDAARLLGLHHVAVLRARAKDERLARRGIVVPSLHDASLDEEALLDWYFRERAPGPRPLDLEGFAVLRGFESGDLFVKAILAEYLVLRGDP